MLRVAVTVSLVAQLGGCSFGCEGPRRQLEPAAGSYRVITALATIDNQRQRIGVAYVTPSFFGGVQVRPLLGRFFVPDEFNAQRSMKTVGVLAFDYWVERFASKPDLIGRTIDIDGVWPTIVGIAPKDFAFPLGSRVAVPEAR